MQFVRPDFYDNFHCLAGACRHSCCVGWEIDVDEETLDLYRRVPGDFGERLRRSVSAAGTPHFILTPDERCPLLRADGLCDLILNLGEDALCDICASHPRFYNEFPGRMEAGLGLCCEEAVRLLTEGTEHLCLLVEENDAGAVLPPLLQQRTEIYAVLRDDAVPLSERMRKALSLLHSQLPPFSAREAARFFLTLERMEDSWTQLLEELASAPEQALEPHLSSMRYARIAEYLIYRHFSSGAEEEAASRLRFCFYAAELICALEPLSQEALRLFSAEIEYSDENIEKIREWLDGQNLFT